VIQASEEIGFEPKFSGERYNVRVNLVLITDLCEDFATDSAITMSDWLGYCGKG